MDKIEATKLHSCMISQLCLMVLLVVTFSATADINGRIVRVLDGDTVEVLETDNQLTRVRLAGIDAPEKASPLVSVRAGASINGGAAYRHCHGH